MSRQVRSHGLPNTQPPRFSGRRRSSKSSYSMFSDQRTRKQFPTAWVLVGLLLFLLVVTAYNLIDSSIARVERVNVTMPGMESAFEGYTILHISDLHGKRFGPAQKQLLAAIHDARFDVVLITGDMVGPEGDPYPFYELLDGLPSNKPVYFIAGDEDPTPVIAEPHRTNDVFDEYIVTAQRKRAIYLDAPVRIKRGDKSLWILPESLLSLDLDAAERKYREQLLVDQMGGNADLPGIKARERMLMYQLDVVQRVRAAQEEMQQGDLHVALSHYPVRTDFLRDMQGWGDSENMRGQLRLDLILAGHLNAGQVRLPFVGPVYVPPVAGRAGGWFRGDKGVHGLSQAAGVAQFINAGLGVSGAYNIPLRLFNAPRVALVTLTSALGD